MSEECVIFAHYVHVHNDFDDFNDHHIQCNVHWMWCGSTTAMIIVVAWVFGKGHVSLQANED